MRLPGRRNYQSPWEEPGKTKLRREVLGVLAGMILFSAIVVVIGGGVAALGWLGAGLVVLALTSR